MPQKYIRMSKLLTIKQASEMLNCHPNTLRHWDNKGVLRAVRVGVRGDRRYNRDDLNRFIREGRNNADNSV